MASQLESVKLHTGEDADEPAKPFAKPLGMLIPDEAQRFHNRLHQPALIINSLAAAGQNVLSTAHLCFGAPASPTAASSPSTVRPASSPPTAGASGSAAAAPPAGEALGRPRGRSLLPTSSRRSNPQPQLPRPRRAPAAAAAAAGVSCSAASASAIVPSSSKDHAAQQGAADANDHLVV